jgi:hypothetical protein
MLRFNARVSWRRRPAGDFALRLEFKNRRRDAGATTPSSLMLLFGEFDLLARPSGDYIATRM